MISITPAFMSSAVMPSIGLLFLKAFTINATGFSGTDCEKATAFLEQALGKLTAKQRKPEWHQRNLRIARQRIGA